VDPIFYAKAKGSRVWDVDDNEYIDFHGGFGVGIAGHAHPKIVEAVTLAVQSGTHFAAPTPVTVALAEEICRRFDLDKVRFANSGTEATMDAIRVARAATGRDVVVKVEGSYHGHHDTVMFSVLPNADALGGRDMLDHITIHVAPTERAEAEFVVHSIEQLIGGHSFFSIDSGRTTDGATANLSFSDFAVLYRTDAQSAALCQAFARSNASNPSRALDT